MRSLAELLLAVLRSLAFLTRLPAPGAAFRAGHRLGDDARAFPLAGLLAALPSAAAVLVGHLLGLGPLATALLAVAVMVAVTGGLHEDGLADLADGLGGHHPRERALEIMKDSRVGTYGALALILSLALRTVLLAELLAMDASGAALALLGVAAASRGAMAWLWSSLPSAAPGGLADRVGQPSRRSGAFAAALGAGLFILLAAPSAGLVNVVLPAVIAALCLHLFRRMLRRRLGGQTGDALGAAQQLTEIALLLGLALAA